MSNKNINNKLNYPILLESIKTHVVANQHRATMSVNSRMIYTYWVIGQHILGEQHKQGWGAKVIELLAKDLKEAFPEMKGLSSRNLKYMRQFAQEWSAGSVKLVGLNTPAVANTNALDSIADSTIEIVQQAAAQNDLTDNPALVQQAAAQNAPTTNEESIQNTALRIDVSFEQFEKHVISRLPWGHHMVLLDKFKTAEQRLFYSTKTVEGGWSREILLNKIEQELHLTQGALPNNFPATLPQAQSELARDTFKDPYLFDFLKIGDEALEKEVEDTLIEQIKQFLLELDAGFAYMGNQYKLEVGGQEYFLDLLFFHTKLNCYITIELKIGEFIPEYVGKVQFYLSAIDELVKSPNHNPSIGLILCKEANSIVAEYALRDSQKPIGIAEYKLGDKLPKDLQAQLPSIKEIEESLSNQKKKDE